MAAAAAVRDDHGLEQRIAGEAIGAVQAGAADLADGVQPAQGGGAIHIRADAAALVVGGRDDRDAVLRHVDAEAEAGLVNIREALADELRPAGGVISR